MYCINITYYILLGNCEVLYNTGKILKKSFIHSFISFIHFLHSKQIKTGIFSLTKANL